MVLQGLPSSEMGTVPMDVVEQYRGQGLLGLKL